MKFTIILFCLFGLNFAAKIVREVIPQRFENCPIEKLSMKMMIAPLKGVNSITITGYIEIVEDITGDLVGLVEANKCDLNVKNCINYSMLKIPDMCDVFSNKVGMFAAAFNTIRPPLKCPLRVGNYTFEETFVDLSLFSMIPIDGAVWMANFKLIGGNGKNKKTVMCWNTETKVIKTKVKS